MTRVGEGDNDVQPPFHLWNISSSDPPIWIAIFWNGNQDWEEEEGEGEDEDDNEIRGTKARLNFDGRGFIYVRCPLT